MEMNEIKQKVLEDVDPEIHRLKKKERRKYRALVTVEFVALIAGIMIVFDRAGQFHVSDTAQWGQSYL